MKIKTITSTIILFISIKLNAQPTEVPATGLANMRNSSIANGDINNDGRMDVLIDGINPSGDYQCKVYINNGNSTFTPARRSKNTAAARHSVPLCRSIKVLRPNKPEQVKG